MFKMVRRPGFAVRLILAAAALAFAAVAAAVFVMGNPDARVRVLNWKLDGMEGADYSSDVANLIRAGRYEEAEKLAAYVSANPKMGGQETVRDLREEIASASKKNKSPIERGIGLVTGFLTGGGDTGEELLGGLLSNILISNKGISESDLPKRARDDSEDIASALEGANLGISGRWFPGLVRTLHLSNLLSPEFKDFLTKNARKSVDEGEPTKELLSAVEGTKETLIALGTQRTLGLFPEVKDSGDLALLAKRGRSSPDETYIVAYLGGIKLLHKLPDTAEGDAMLSKIAQKGRPAIESANFWLK